MTFYPPFASCIQRCHACALACDRCVLASLGEAEPGIYAACIALAADCAQACRLAAAYMARSSPQAVAACDFCARICDACAEECVRHVAPDRQKAGHCRDCAESCYRCAEECRRMIGLLSGMSAASL